MNNGKNLIGKTSFEAVLEKQNYSSPIVDVVELSCDIITTSQTGENPVGINWGTQWGTIEDEWG